MATPAALTRARPPQASWQAGASTFAERVAVAVNGSGHPEDANYALFQDAGLGALRLLVLARRDLLPLVGGASQAVLSTGVAGAPLGKGAVGVSCQVMGTQLCFVNAHLAADLTESALTERNRMYKARRPSAAAHHAAVPMPHSTGQVDTQG